MSAESKEIKKEPVEKTSPNKVEDKKEETKEPPTKRQLDLFQKQQEAFYKEKLPFLRMETEYSKMLADVEEHRLRRLSCQIKHAQLATEIQRKQAGEGAVTSQPEVDPDNKPETETKKA